MSPEEVKGDIQGDPFGVEAASDVAEQQSLEELVERVSIQRAEALAAKEIVAQTAGAAAVEAVATEPVAPISSEEVEARKSKKGGAFGGALKRRIEQTDSAEKLSATNQQHIAMLEPENLRKQLFETDGDQVYEFRVGRPSSPRVVLTPREYMALTLSPRKLAGRIGANVLEHTSATEPTEQQASKAEKVEKNLQIRHSYAITQLTSLKIDEEVFKDLRKEMRSPGYAHMGQEEMDALMAHAEGVFVDMFKAITTNRELGTEMVKSLTAALDYRLSKDKYKETFSYWEAMCQLGLRWTKLKTAAFTAVKKRVDEEYESRFHRKLNVVS